MQSADWAPEHSEALREFLAKGLSFARIANAINAKFNTAYSRNATIGRARRMGLAAPCQPGHSPKPARRVKAPRLHAKRQSRPPKSVPKSKPIVPVCEAAKTVKLRCVDINPRHLSFMALERGDCRYPYGGDADGEAITFCGHPRRLGSSYCVAHFHLTRGPGTASERAAVTVALRLVEAA